MDYSQTLALIKPDAVQEGHTGQILAQIQNAGFRIHALKLTALSKDKAEDFYSVHKDRSFFDNLTSYMSSAPIVAMVLGKSNAVEDFRTLIGATKPEEAEPGTIRAQFAKSVEANAVHGSDSDENANRESAFFFSSIETF
jgi:nucleoside-diphosphate kinase